MLIALVLAPVILALSKGNDWGWASAATLGCFAVAIVSIVLFVRVERRVEAPLVDLQLLRNRVLVGATLAILHRRGHDQRADVRPQPVLPESRRARAERVPGRPGDAARGGGDDRDHAARSRRWRGRSAAAAAVALGFVLAAIGFAALAFVQASWAYVAFVAAADRAVGRPGHLQRAGVVGLDRVGVARPGRPASGISNMARYVGAAVAVAAIAMIDNAVADNHKEAGESAARGAGGRPRAPRR